MNHEKILNWGIISTGYIAERFAEDLRHVPQARLYSIVSRTTERSNQFAHIWNVPNAYSDYE